MTLLFSIAVQLGASCTAPPRVGTGCRPHSARTMVGDGCRKRRRGGDARGCRGSGDPIATQLPRPTIPSRLRSLPHQTVGSVSGSRRAGSPPPADGGGGARGSSTQPPTGVDQNRRHRCGVAATGARSPWSPGRFVDRPRSGECAPVQHHARRGLAPEPAPPVRGTDGCSAPPRPIPPALHRFGRMPEAMRFEGVAVYQFPLAGPIGADRDGTVAAWAWHEWTPDRSVGRPDGCCRLASSDVDRTAIDIGRPCPSPAPNGFREQVGPVPGSPRQLRAPAHPRTVHANPSPPMDHVYVPRPTDRDEGGCR